MGFVCSKHETRAEVLNKMIDSIHLPEYEKSCLRNRTIRKLGDVEKQTKRLSTMSFGTKLILYPSSASAIMYVIEKTKSLGVIETEYSSLFIASIVLQALGFIASGVSDAIQIPRKVPLTKKYVDDLDHEVWSYLGLIDDYSEMNHLEAFPLVSRKCEAIITRNERYLTQLLSPTRNGSGSYRNTGGQLVNDTDAFTRDVRTEILTTRPTTPLSSREDDVRHRLENIVSTTTNDVVINIPTLQVPIPIRPSRTENLDRTLPNDGYVFDPKETPR